MGEMRVADIVRTMRDLAAKNLISLFAWLAVMTALGIAVDFAETEQGARLLNLALSCTVIVAQYSVARSLLWDIGALGEKPASFLRFLVLSLVASIAVLIGMIAIIIPGVILAIRWSAATPALLAGNTTIAQALGYSWDATADHGWPILKLLSAIWLPVMALFGVCWFLPDLYSAPVSFAFNLLYSVATIAAWLAAVAIFAFLQGRASIARRSLA